jgi:hypothetical protein
MTSDLTRVTSEFVRLTPGAGRHKSKICSEGRLMADPRGSPREAVRLGWHPAPGLGPAGVRSAAGRRPAGVCGPRLRERQA